MNIFIKYLSELTNGSDLEKVWIVYLWIAYNINFDFDGYIMDKLEPYFDYDLLMNTKIAQVKNLTNLFECLCKKMNI